MKEFYDFYSWGSENVGTTPIYHTNDKVEIESVVKDIITNNVEIVQNGDNIDIKLNDNVLKSIPIPDEAAFETATYNKDTKELTFEYDINGEKGETSVDLTDLSDVYSGENGISVENNNISVKFNKDSLKLNENGELETVHTNVWETI